MERRRADAAEQASRNFLDSFIELIPYPAFYKDADRRYIGCNRPFEEFWGLRKSQIAGRLDREVMPVDISALHDPNDRALLETPGSRSYAAAVTAADGAAHEVIFNITTLLRTDGTAGGITGILIDVTERRKMLDQLRQLSRAVEQSPATVVITDTKGTIEYVNPKFTLLTGYTAAEALGTNPRILKSGKQPPEFYRDMWETISAGKEWRGEFHNLKKNGESYWESASISPVTDEKGEITHYLAVKEDITDRKLALEALRVSEENLRERNRIMEMDLRIAQITQNALLMQPVPESGLLKIEYRYVPLEKVGGDYFSFMPLENGDMAVFIGDVSGHGVVSALFLALVKFATERIFRDFARLPAEYLRRLNSELIGSMSSYFITGIYGVFEAGGDPPGAVFRFSNGGHPPPILLKAGGQARYLDAPGTIIGAFESASYGESSITLEKGDRVFLYTDGIPEAHNSSRERIGFGDDLLELFRASSRPGLGETLDRVMGSVEAFRGDMPPDDDMVLVGIEVI
jgi:PAS domain S-box-containing protein